VSLDSAQVYPIRIIRFCDYFDPMFDLLDALGSRQSFLDVARNWKYRDMAISRSFTGREPQIERYVLF
jgi:hypothetical protein